MQEKFKPNREISHTSQFYVGLNADKLLTKYIWFARIKYRGVIRCFDTNGGFIKFSEIKQLPKYLNTSKSNVQKLFKSFEELSWIEETKTGYRLRGCLEIAKVYVPEIKQVRFILLNKKDLLTKIANNIVRQSINRQIYKDTKLTKARLNSKSKILATKNKYSLSVRTIAKKMGYKSPMSGTNIERMLEKAGLFKIERNVRELCDVSEYNLRVKAGQELESKCFIKNGKVYERMRNNLIPIHKKENTKLTDFLKQAKAELDLKRVA